TRASSPSPPCRSPTPNWAICTRESSTTCGRSSRCWNGPPATNSRFPMSSSPMKFSSHDQPLCGGTVKGDLVEYLDFVADRFVPVLRGRPLSVWRILRGQDPFMQKNVPKYTPDYVKTVEVWAETSHRQIKYALCDDKQTLMWF